MAKRNGLDNGTPFGTRLGLSILFLFLTAVNALAILRFGSMTFTVQKWAYALGLSVLLAGLLVYVLYTALPRQRYRTVQHRAAYYPFLAGVLGLLAMSLSYIWLGVWPLGKESVMIVDLHHQYGPLLSQLREMYQNGGDMLYTFSAGIGSNFLSLFAYYLASPFNLLLKLFPLRLLPEAVLVITLLKNALTAAAFAACMQYVLKRHDLSVVFFALGYSLSMYLLAYSWNIMWLDAVMVLPLAVLGFERMMRQRKYGVYILSLAYILLTNYYIGFMVCVFFVLYYLTFALREKRSAAAQGRCFFRFTLGSLLGGGLAMCLLLPVFFALRYTSAAGETLPETNANFQLFRLFGQMLFGMPPTIRSGNLPNIYCGILPLICLPLFFTTRAIPLRRRLAFGGLLAALSVSFTVNIFDLTWHGLHAPNDLPYRFSFLFIFTVLLIGGMLFSHLSDIRPRQIGISAAGVLGAIVLFEALQEKGSVVFQPVYVSALLLLLYCGIFLLTTYRKLAKRVGLALLAMVMTVELTIHGGLALDALNGNEYYTDHENYVDNAETAAMQTAVRDMQKLADAENENGFYRAEILPRRTCVDTALFHYRGLTSFSSSNYYLTTKLLGNLGYADNGVNSCLYESFVPAVDSLLGVRYLALQNDITTHPQLEKIGESTTENGVYYFYRNTLALPLAYRVEADIQRFSSQDYAPFATQENLLSAMTGDDTPLYTFLPITVSPDSTDIASANGSHFSISAPGGDAWFTATVAERAQYYIFVDCTAAKSASVSTTLPDGTFGNTWDPSLSEAYIIDAGVLDAESGLDFCIHAEMAVSGNIYIAALDTAVLEEKITSLSKDGMQVTSFTDSRITGKISTAENGVLFTSIPYDSSWTVTVDGQKVKTYPVGDVTEDGTGGAFLACDIGFGTHEITLRYIPRGLPLGLLLSAVSLLLFILLLLITHRPRPQTDASAGERPAPSHLPPADTDETLTDAITLERLMTADFTLVAPKDEED